IILSVFASFSLTTRRPSSSPPFPYTTLFRSVVDVLHPRHHPHRFQPVPHPPEGADHLPDPVQGGAGQAGGNGCGQQVGPVVDPRDRKSTRLNSSHVKISYAVFCLKKKTKQTR